MIEKEYEPHIRTYGGNFYLFFDPGEEPNDEQARAYLAKYWLPEEEYMRVWKPIQDAIFINQEELLPKMMFRDAYFLMPLTGGSIFDKPNYLMLQKCLHAMGETEFVIIENNFGRHEKDDCPPFRLKYPVTTSYEELESGSYISKVLFSFFYKTYFVYSATKRWAKYVDNDHIYPLDIVACLPAYADLFLASFQGFMDDEQKRAVLRTIKSLPAYRQYDKHLH